MILIFRQDAAEAEIQNALRKIESLGYTPHLSRGAVKTICGVTGDDRSISETEFDQLPGVESVLRVLKPYKLASREFHPDATRIEVNGVPIGPGTFVVVAGPCSVESEEQVESTAALMRLPRAALHPGAGRSSRAPPRTPSRAWASRAWRSSPPRPAGTASPWSPRSCPSTTWS